MIINFTVFIDKILDGSKTQTIRKVRKGKRQIKIGDTLQFYTGPRKNKRKLIGTAICSKIENIGISGRFPDFKICLGEKLLSFEESEAFAWADGFGSDKSPFVPSCDFCDFFESHYGLPFYGIVIHWKDFKPAMLHSQVQGGFDKLTKRANQRENSAKTILDVCCGGRMWWYDKTDSRACFMDNRKFSTELCDGREFGVSPDVVGDFRSIPFPDETFQMVLFDPPHLRKAGEKSWLATKYGLLGKNWRDDLRKGFSECFRVLKPLGTLIFKWNEDQIKLSSILKLTDEKPLVSHKRQKTHFVIFMKGGTK